MTDDRRPADGDGEPPLARAFRLPAVLSGLLLAGIMLLTAADVALRYLAGAPIFGAHEVTEIAMVALIMLAMPHCGASGGHIRIDVLDRALGPFGRFIGDLVGGIVGLTVLGFLVWRTGVKVVDAYTYDDLTNMLVLPIWPIYLVIVLGMGGYAVVVAHDLFVLLFRRSRRR